MYNNVDGHRKFSFYMKDIAIHGLISKSLFYCVPRDRAFNDQNGLVSIDMLARHSVVAYRFRHQFPQAFDALDLVACGLAFAFDVCFIWFRWLL